MEARPDLLICCKNQGNCKFGPKCALLHIVQGGRVVNRPSGMVAGNLNLGGRIDPNSYHNQDGMGGNSLLSQQANNFSQPFANQIPPIPDIDVPTSPPQMNMLGYDNPVPFDNGFMPHPDSKYGSPRDETSMPLSPIMHLSTLDAPLPASFDSQGISYMARHGPVAASVPSKFGLESPPQSLPKRSLLPTDSLRSPQEPPYGRENRARTQTLSSSPSTQAEDVGPRMMHSQRVARPKMMSASLPRPAMADDWGDEFLFGGEEDYIPSNLSHLLSAEEKSRRFSSNHQDPGATRDSLSGHQTPADVNSKVGSPSTSSPSRFTALFNKQKRDEEMNGLGSSPFNHIGSPLRNTSSFLSTSPSLRSVARPDGGDIAFKVSSPPRHSSMSMLSQQLQRTRLSSRAESGENATGLHPLPTRHVSNPRSPFDRAVSSSSVGTSRIEEEQPDLVFPLDEEVYSSNKTGGPWGNPKSPNLGPIGHERHKSSEEAKAETAASKSADSKPKSEGET
jgi:hypothetical protein